MNQNLRVNKTNFHMKGFALGLALKQRRKATRKSPIQWLSVSCEKGRNRLGTFDEPTACFLTGADVVLFCVRADFSNDEVCMSFSGENGVRSILLNGKVQLPVLQVQLA